MPDDTKGSQTITIANGLAEKVYVRVDPLDLVVQTEAREKQFGVGAAISGSANANFGLGQADLTLIKSERQTQSVYPHSFWDSPVAKSSLGRKGKSANVSNSIQVHVYIREVTREGRSKKVELGEGFLVGRVAIEILSQSG
eukprot:TRINITY_DN9741_c0_g1_i1.p1 TRINITY_DN9741_c0_g1~~TRINITY_DN9741_c0_g1_i1.p1  ORF type:complete len:162 (-),score=37.71 TRINITY_DN9741_c0_g1_i1:286-708(-)